MLIFTTFLGKISCKFNNSSIGTNIANTSKPFVQSNSSIRYINMPIQYILWACSALKLFTFIFQRSGSKMAQEIPCFLMAPSHYLKQYWILSVVFTWGNFAMNFQARILYDEFENCTLKLLWHFPGVQWLEKLQSRPSRILYSVCTVCMWMDHQTPWGIKQTSSPMTQCDFS